jgi:hypothetical protein
MPPAVASRRVRLPDGHASNITTLNPDAPAQLAHASVIVLAAPGVDQGHGDQRVLA